MAVLAQMYGVSSPSEQLTDVQQLHMVVLADLLQVEAVAAKAANALTAAAPPEQQLSDAAVHYMLSMEAWPACLVAVVPSLCQRMPLQAAAAIWVKAAGLNPPAGLGQVLAAPHSQHMQQLLVHELGSLEDVWANAGKKAQLLGLPLPAMQLLLSSDKLKVRQADCTQHTSSAYMLYRQLPMLRTAR